MKNIFLLTISFLIIFSSCEKKLDIDIPDTEKHIVLNGIINPDSIIKVRVTKSKSVLDNSKIQNLSDADVKLYKNDEFAENLQYSDSGFFYSTIIPDINSNYKITVEYENLKSVDAEISLYTPPVIKKVDTIIQTEISNYVDGMADTTYKIHFELQFDDPATSSDYYFLSVSQLTPVFDYTNTNIVFTGYKEYNGYFNTNDPVLIKENNEFYLNQMNGSVFSDELFNGNSYTLSFSTDYQNYRNIDYKSNRTAQYPSMIVLKLLKVTEAIHNYIFSYNLNQQTKFDPFAQPVQVYSNVENGLGLVSGYTMTTDTIVLNNIN